MECRGCGEEKPAEVFALRSDKGYRRRTCNDCMNLRQRQRQAKYRADRRAWKERTKWGAKGGKASLPRETGCGTWLQLRRPATSETQTLRLSTESASRSMSSYWNSRQDSAPSAVVHHEAGRCSMWTMITLRESCAACFAGIAIGPSDSWMTTLSLFDRAKTYIVRFRK